VQKEIEKKLQKEAAFEKWYNENLRDEIHGIVLLALGFGLYAVYFSSGTAAFWIHDFFQQIFGLGAWVLPLVFIGFGISVLSKNLREVPIPRFGAMISTFVVALGLINLTLPLSESSAMASQYGGAIGFAVGYFPRILLGDTFTLVLFLFLLWLCLTVGYGLRTRPLIDWCMRKLQGTTEQISEKVLPILEGDNNEKIENEEGHGASIPEIIDSQNLMPVNVKVESMTDKTEDNEPRIPGEDQTKKSLNKGERDQSTTQIPHVPLPIDILRNDHSTVVANESELQKLASIIVTKFAQFGITVEMKSVFVGPTVTQFALEPAAGVKLTKIKGLKDDLKLALAAETLRIEAPIRGKSLVGIEIPNKKRANVGFREVIESQNFRDEKSQLKLCVGRDSRGEAVVVNLQKMPHLLIAGKTGSGKSVGMNAFLCSLLWNNSPSQLKLILIDPKRVELKPYNKIPHLLTPVITEPEKATSALAWAVAEMNRRYKALEESGTKDLQGYNKKHPEKTEPFIVIVIDELADLMMVAGKDVEAAICRIAQLARAVGIHLIIATQRPSVDVVTGLIKANLPARMAFKVSSGIDSRTILDTVGAEDLLGFGDMLYLDGNNGAITRLQGLWIRDEEIQRIVNNLVLNYPAVIMEDAVTTQSIDGMAKGGVLTAGLKEDLGETDALYEKAVETVLQHHKASASFLQRMLEIGYARAARILDQMEKRGVIGPVRGAKPREIYGTGLREQEEVVHSSEW